jgi:hypothetical protein
MAGDTSQRFHTPFHAQGLQLPASGTREPRFDGEDSPLRSARLEGMHRMPFTKRIRGDTVVSLAIASAEAPGLMHASFSPRARPQAVGTSTPANWPVSCGG